MKKALLMTMVALTMIFTQCKKAENIMPQGGTTQPDGQVYITLNVGGGSKVDVNPSSGIVMFTSGDVVYVASDGKYVGTLTHNGTEFTGPISNPKEGEPLYFYFLGNKCTTATLEPGTTAELTADISDQSASLPVISCAPSTVNYSPELGAYSAKLLNKCGLVKFTTSDYTGSGTLSVKKMNNKATVDLSDNTFTYDKATADGIITLNKASDGVYWAILLPQAAVEGSTGGDAFSSDSWTGIYGAVPAIAANSYVASGVAISNAAVTHEYVDLGLPSGLLWATCNVGAENPEDYGNYYAWGETTTKSTYNWTTYQWCNGSLSKLTKYCTQSSYGYNGFVDNKTVLEMSDDAARANWGGDWRMPTKTEMEELENNCTWTWTTQSGKNGYTVTGSNSNSIFLPAAGCYYVSSLHDAGSYGYYWSSSLSTGNPIYAYHLNFCSSGVDTGSHYRSFGPSVRPVCPPQN